MELLRCTDLKKVYGKGDTAVCALNGIDLMVERGTFVAVVGASGSGKSTLLHLLAGVDSPTAGQVLIDGVEVGSLDPTQAALFRRRKVGLIYQFFNLIPTLSVEKNIALPLLLDKRKPTRFSWIRCSGPWVWKRSAAPCRGSYPAGSSSGWPSPGRSATARPCCWRTSPPAIWTGKNSAEILDLLRLFHKISARPSCW